MNYNIEEILEMVNSLESIVNLIEPRREKVPNKFFDYIVSIENILLKDENISQQIIKLRNERKKSELSHLISRKQKKLMQEKKCIYNTKRNDMIKKIDAWQNQLNCLG